MQANDISRNADRASITTADNILAQSYKKALAATATAAAASLEDAQFRAASAERLRRMTAA